MVVLLGPQMILEEFEEIDVSISWLETPFPGARFTIMGTENFFVVMRNGEVTLKSQEYEVVDFEGRKILIVCGNEAMYPEVFYFGKSQGAQMGVVFSKAGNPGELALYKAKFWIYSQDNHFPVLSLIKFLDKVQYNVYIPMEETQKGNGILSESTAPSIVRFEEGMKIPTIKR